MNEQDLLHEIFATPDDDLPRLIYADWLDEKGDPRGEFIRVQCELARLPNDDPRCEKLRNREKELLEAYECSWTPPNQLSLFYEWRRGFVAILRPCTRGLFNGEDSLKVLAEFPLAVELEFGISMRDEEFRHMPDLPNLQTFGVMGNSRISNASVPKIGKWRTLRRLTLSSDTITDGALPHLSDLHELRELDLSYTGITDAALSRLATFRSLESLDLNDTELTGHGLDALRRLPNLRRLNLNNTRIWEQGVGGLVGCQQLEEVRLHSDALNRVYINEDLMPLLQLPALRILELGWSNPTETFLQALRQRSPNLELWIHGERLDYESI